MNARYYRNLKRETMHSKRAGTHLTLAQIYGAGHPLHEPHRAAFTFHNALARVYREIAVANGPEVNILNALLE